jgi:hypothetical protein
MNGHACLSFFHETSSYLQHGATQQVHYESIQYEQLEKCQNNGNHPVPIATDQNNAYDK